MHQTFVFYQAPGAYGDIRTWAASLGCRIIKADWDPVRPSFTIGGVGCYQTMIPIEIVKCLPLTDLARFRKPEEDFKLVIVGGITPDVRPHLLRLLEEMEK